MKAKSYLYSAIEDLIALFYPSTCIVCEEKLLKDEESICKHFIHKIPKKYCFKQAKNSVSKLFWGRIQLENSVALYQFQKEGSVQKLMRQLKYEGGKSSRHFLR